MKKKKVLKRKINIIKPTQKINTNIILFKIKQLLDQIPEVEKAKGSVSIKVAGIKPKKVTFTYQSNEY